MTQSDPNPRAEAADPSNNDRPNEHGDGPFWHDAPAAYHDMQAVAELGHNTFEIDGPWPHEAERVLLRLVTSGPTAGAFRRSFWSVPQSLALELYKCRPPADWHRSLNAIFSSCRRVGGEPVQQSSSPAV